MKGLLPDFTWDKDILPKTIAAKDKEGSKVIKDIVYSKDNEHFGFEEKKVSASIDLAPVKRNSKKFYQTLDSFKVEVKLDFSFSNLNYQSFFSFLYF